MALVKCQDCGTDISTEAKACPRCGRPAPPVRWTPPRWLRLAVRWVVLLVIALAGAAALVNLLGRWLT